MVNTLLSMTCEFFAMLNLFAFGWQFEFPKNSSVQNGNTKVLTPIFYYLANSKNTRNSKVVQKKLFYEQACKPYHGIGVNCP